MNRNRHRLVFSKKRGMLVAVGETATATAAGKQAGQTHAGSQHTVVRRALFTLQQIAFAAFAAFALLGAMPIFAQIVGGGARAPNVIQTQNGLDQVNINRPSGAGVSVNTYNRFDVQARGAIVNNSPAIVQTQQAGMINGNPNFGPGQAAKVIVNQVNSPTASQLNGALEIAGQRAEMILANPSGIAVNGGAFINTSRAILTTGTPNYAADGSVSGFNVTGGTITVSGAGMNVSNVDQVDLLARAVQANSAIYAKNLNVIAGANNINHDTLAATPIAGDGPAPGVSIDVSSLGGMYANRIVLAGSELGVGVSLKGIVAANAGDLVLTSAGKLVLAGQTNASGNISASARDGIDNSGTTYAQQNVSATTGGALNNGAGGTIGGNGNVALQAGQIANTGSITAVQSLIATAVQALFSSGTLAANGNMTLSAGTTLANNGQLSAGRLLVLSAETFDNSYGMVSAGQLALHAANLMNRGGSITQTGTGDTTVDVSGTLDNANGSLLSNATNFSLGAASLVNDDGTIANAGTGTLTARTDTLSNDNGTIATNGALDVSAGATSNRGGTFAAQTGAALTVASLDNSAGGYIGAKIQRDLRIHRTAQALVCNGRQAAALESRQRCRTRTAMRTAMRAFKTLHTSRARIAYR
ncbi:filamentous hemagglutinin N-terminal domain-containing protein [Paraburkholderia tagetis]|uniref:two-partner secretion domain-containing protein n=1 Tax=Paraburkholderia tagetis TaxID=2913261 RepID=UPI002368A863|nr:filamentous hemagglutinin N-terminal domain-containing protein [Paraburkholderia tagetis]